MTTKIHADVVIIGGGIAGLWLFRTLSLKGYKAILLEKNALGGEQTIKSQGIIHGGTKYTLSGKLTKASQCIATMPERWRKALAGEGELDLSATKVLSNHHYLWSPGGLGSRLTSFFASKALRGRVDLLSPAQHPAIFQHNAFKGKVYQLNEIVLDIVSAVKALTAGLENRCIKVNWHDDTRLITNNGDIESINIHHSGETFELTAKRFITTAGEGTAELMSQWGITEPQMQVRPLHMVMVKHSHNEPIYAHCIGMRQVPRMTITTHPTADGQWVWYLGGEIAEKGVNKSPEQLITEAKSELASILPWVNLQDAQWGTLKVNRAEPKQNSLLRPDAAYCHPINNGIITWPTKLALAPNLSDEVIKLLEKSNIKPSGNDTFHLQDNLIRPSISAPFWSDYLDSHS